MIEILTALDLQHFKEMQALERKFYQDDHITPAERAYQWYKTYPYTTVAAAEGGKVVGFVNLFPVTDDTVQRLQAGTLDERTLALEDIVDISASGGAPLHMFLCCIAVEETARRHGLALKLLRAAVAQYEAVADRCDIILADNITKDGENFSRKYGLAPARKSGHGSWIYAGGYRQFLRKVLDLHKE